MASAVSTHRIDSTISMNTVKVLLQSIGVVLHLHVVADMPPALTQVPEDVANVMWNSFAQPLPDQRYPFAQDVIFLIFPHLCKV